MEKEDKKPGRGRPAFEPTQAMRSKIAIMAACGMPQDFMCTQIINPQTKKAIDKKTLEKVFRAELDQGMVEANGHVAQALFKKAVGGGAQSVTAAIFWLKCRAGWKPVEGVELTGKDGKPIQTEGAPIDEKAVAAIVGRLKAEFIDS